MQESADLKDYITRRSRELSPAEQWSREEGVLLIGTDATEWAEGYENLVALFGARSAEPEGPIFTLGDDLRAFTEGTVGWARCHLTWRLPDGREIPGRVTAVFRKEGDDWATVQAHFSLAVPNEEAFG